MALSIMNCFDLNALKAQFKDAKKDIVYMARTAEAAERYEDMCSFMKELVNNANAAKRDLNVEERNLLSVAYKNVVGSRRASFRTLNTTVSEAKDEEEKALATAYRGQVEEELSKICNEVLALLEGPLLANSKTNEKTQHESQVFYLKMAGDYYRYMSEFVQDKAIEQKSGSFYSKAMDIAKEHLEATHPIRLGLALNYSVCHYEILKDKKQACTLAKEAFDLAIAGLDKLPEASYKDSTLIMQLLRDNLTLWTSADDNQSEVEVGEDED